MGVVYEVFSEGVWRKVSSEEYEHFEGRKRTRPKGIPAGFYAVTNLLIAYSGR